MSLGDVRLTVLQTVQEVFRKLGLAQPIALNSNALSILTIDFINDICSEMADFGNWQETFVSSNVTAVSGRGDYSINTSANIKNIGQIFFTERTGPMRYITPDQMRILTRVTSVGQPTQFTIYGTDAVGNPNIRLRPTPNSQADGGLLSITYYIRAPKYTVSDGSEVVPFPATVVVLGVLARCILNESGGSPTDHYTMVNNEYIESRKEALNRFNGDTGYDISYSPSMINWRRR